MFAVYNKNNLYASYVFVTMDKNNDVEYYDASAAGLLYVLSKEGTYTTADQKTYTKYNVLDETGTKIVVEADDSAPFGAGGTVGNVTGIYKAFYQTSKDTNGRYSKATALGVGDAQSGHYFSRNWDTNTGANKITYSSGTLSISGENFTLANDAKLYLITLKDENSINKTAADYEVQAVSAQTLASLLNSYTEATYIAEGRVDGSYTDGDTVLKELYVTVTGYGNGIINPTYAATVTGLPAGSDTKYTVYDSNDNVVTGPTAAAATTVNLTLEAGAYTVVVEDNDTTDTEFYQTTTLALNVTANGANTVAYDVQHKIAVTTPNRTGAALTLYAADGTTEVQTFTAVAGTTQNVFAKDGVRYYVGYSFADGTSATQYAPNKVRIDANLSADTTADVGAAYSTPGSDIAFSGLKAAGTQTITLTNSAGTETILTYSGNDTTVTFKVPTALANYKVTATSTLGAVMTTDAMSGTDLDNIVIKDMTPAAAIATVTAKVGSVATQQGGTKTSLRVSIAKTSSADAFVTGTLKGTLEVYKALDNGSVALLKTVDLTTANVVSTTGGLLEAVESGTTGLEVTNVAVAANATVGYQFHVTLLDKNDVEVDDFTSPLIAVTTTAA